METLMQRCRMNEKQEKTADAWQHYKQALDLLQGQTTQEEDQKQATDALVLILHLNLAACELKLGDNDEVIAHCNKALELSTKSVKAYFRRGQAYQNKKEYKLAFKDYQLVICMEPDNTLVRSHLEKCQQLMEDEKQTGEESPMLDNPEENVYGDHEMEVGFENEAELPARFRNCTKNPGHVDFISVIDFQMAHLPEEYHDTDLLDLLHQYVKLAVRIRVAGNSEHRPLLAPDTTDTPYPFSGMRFRKTVRVGIGWIHQARKFMDVDGQDCPCSTCQTSGEPRKCWGKIQIWTAAHVVFDLIEGKKTTCYFDYDSDDTDIESCPSLKGAIKVVSNTKSDTSAITFITHDTDWVDKLRDTIWLSRRLCSKVKEKFKVADNTETGGDLISKLSNLYDRLSITLSLLDKQREMFSAIFHGDIYQHWQDRLVTHHSEGGDPNDVLGGLILDKINGGGSAERLLQALSRSYENSRIFLNDIKEFIQKHGNSRESDQKLEIYALYHTKVTMAEREVNMYKKILEDDSVDYPISPAQFCSTCPLTVIISHPHGCSKKITIGQIVERKGEMKDISSQYRYTNSTCPGSSGARTFILGKTGSVFDLPHSGTSGGNVDSQMQVNESAVYGDI